MKNLPNLEKIKRPILAWYDDHEPTPRIFYPNQKHFDEYVNYGFFQMLDMIVGGKSKGDRWLSRISPKKNEIFKDNLIAWQYV